MINLTQVGASVSGNIITFGIYLPNITPTKKYSVVVLVIHEDDQFTETVLPRSFPLTYNTGTPYDLWNVSVNISAPGPPSNFGNPGNYLYRYQLLQNGVINTLWFTDPFAKASGIGELAFVSVGNSVPFAWQDQDFVVPDLDDLVVYELQVSEFNATFDGVIARLPYLKGLGVNMIEFMPIYSTKQEFDWGYGPLYFMSPKYDFGGIDGFKRLVNECHKHNIAVILDSVYEHVDPHFAYKLVYDNTGEQSPMIGHFADSLGYGPETDFNQAFCREYFFEVNKYWLDEFHVDGFRYDYVPGYYDGSTGNGYANLVYQTYQYSLAAGFSRFKHPKGFSKIMQCAEDLNDPKGILRETYTCATWQDGLLNKARELPSSNVEEWKTKYEDFAHLLDTGFSNYPSTKSVMGIDMPVAPFQYIESHDHSYLIGSIGLCPPLGGQGDIQYGDRDLYFKLQPYVIALYTCSGIPMLWQGQEFAENFTLPEGGNLRISFRRDIHWEYFYDTSGRSLITLYRKMAALRLAHTSLKSRTSFYFNEQSRPWEKLIAYSRTDSNGEVALVVLNFSDYSQEISLPFPKAGTYTEKLDGSASPIVVAAKDDFHKVTVNSNYGVVFVVP